MGCEGGRTGNDVQELTGAVFVTRRCFVPKQASLRSAPVHGHAPLPLSLQGVPWSHFRGRVPLSTDRLSPVRRTGTSSCEASTVPVFAERQRHRLRN